MRPIESQNGHSQEELSPFEEEQLVAYEEAKAAGERVVMDTPADDSVREALACVDLLHKVWPDDGNAAALPDEPPLPKTLGDFRLIHEIGSGGMGTVFEAEQLSMGRRVALKVLPFAALVRDKSLQRFRNEVRAAAALDHPHIVSVYSVGEERGVHFYAMQLIRGQTLADMIRELRNRCDEPSGTIPDRLAGPKDDAPMICSAASSAPSTNQTEQARISTVNDSRRAAERFRSAARLGIQAADALQHAHDQGVLHRDIKPSNLLVDAEGQLYITDFGLARIESDAGMTMTGDILGTLRYMAPEQALAKRVVIDQRADIYSLGATLYELLTLQPVFAETDRSELLKQIAFEEPRSLRKLERRIPVELVTIVLKAMAKQRDERYQTAQQLSADLRAVLEHRPITAKRPTLVNRAFKWSRRHQSLVWTVAIASVLLSAILAVSMALMTRAESRTVAALEETSELLYEAEMALAYQAFERGWSKEAARLLARFQPVERGPHPRGFEWHLLHSAVKKPVSIALVGHAGSVNEIAVFPDGERLASVGDDGTLRIWDLHSQKLLRTFPLGAEPLYSVAVSPDGRIVVAGSKIVHLCDLSGSGRVQEIFRSDHNFESLAFRADGARIAAGSRYHDVYVLTPSGELVGRTPCGSRVHSLEFISNENLLLLPNRGSASDGDEVGVAQLWSDDLSVLQKQFDSTAGSGDANITVARSLSNWQFLLVGERNKKRAHLIDADTRQVVASTGVFRCQLSDLAISPNGYAVAISYIDGTIEYYELQSRQGIISFSRPRIFQAHEGEILATRFVSAERLATCGADGVINLWTLSYPRAYDLSELRVEGVCLSPDGSLLLYTYRDGYLIVDSSNGQVLHQREYSIAPQSKSAWSPTADRFAVCLESASKGQVRVFDRKGAEVCSIDHAGRPKIVSFSPNDPLIAVLGNKQLQICNAESGKEISQQSLLAEGYDAAFSHDGKWFAYGGNFDRIYVCAIPGMHSQRELVRGTGTTSVAFSPDDKLLATGHHDGIVRLWDLATGDVRAEILGHEHRVEDLAFSPDGRTLLSSDGAIRVWSVGHARSYGVFSDPDGHMSLSADGRRLAAGFGRESLDGRDVLIWNIDPATGKLNGQFSDERPNQGTIRN